MEYDDLLNKIIDIINESNANLEFNETKRVLIRKIKSVFKNFPKNKRTKKSDNSKERVLCVKPKNKQKQSKNGIFIMTKEISEQADVLHKRGAKNE